MKSNIEIKIDYFSATFPLDVDEKDSVQYKVHEMVRCLCTYLNVKNFELSKEKHAQNNYNYQYNLGQYIILRLDGPLNDFYQKTCHLEMKGEGCRDFERRNPDKSWINFLLFMAELNCRFKRIDIAIDDFEGIDVTMGWLLEKINKKLYTSVFRGDAELHGKLNSGLTIQFGSHSSPIQLVIYDKKMERQKRKIKCDKKYWVRYEMRFRNEHADRIALAFISGNTKDKKEFNLQKFAFEQLYRIIDIKEDNNYDTKSQNKVATDLHWLSFLENVEKGALPKLEIAEDKTFEEYMKAARPYVSMWLLVKYLDVCRDPYLFELEIYKYLSNGLAFSKQRFQRLNMFLDQHNLKTIDDVEFAALKEEFKGIVSERELPF